MKSNKIRFHFFQIKVQKYITVQSNIKDNQNEGDIAILHIILTLSGAEKVCS